MKIVIHCADTPDDRDVSAEDIHQWHKDKGWDGIGYHWIIRRDGRLEAGRPEYWTGAHVRGYNSGSIGICLIGRNNFTEAQFDALWTKLNSYGAFQLYGHCDLDPSKTCPNFDVQAWWEARQ